ncbi:hypothetical protein EJ04DRAFT_519222 [Polyplosphaeria fusca]|uniref:Uncharacterized protein n=1 Tax=Polyplosphaeria fusca TaxID=682080 RepID=A0A9P4R8F6_9PLEO|nr:hypothetical protein EJ04DRAFT_519222 [Polyplosphaeria fusca]
MGKATAFKSKPHCSVASWEHLWNISGQTERGGPRPSEAWRPAVRPTFADCRPPSRPGALAAGFALSNRSNPVELRSAHLLDHKPLQWLAPVDPRYSRHRAVPVSGSHVILISAKLHQACGSFREDGKPLRKDWHASHLGKTVAEAYVCLASLCVTARAM